MKNVKTPTSDSYHDYLISSLKDPEESAAYIEAILEEKDPEPELFRRVLSNVVEALGELNMSPEEAKLHQEKLEELIAKPGIYAIYSLGDWLQALGLKLSVTVKAD